MVRANGCAEYTVAASRVGLYQSISGSRGAEMTLPGCVWEPPGEAVTGWSASGFIEGQAQPHHSAWWRINALHARPTTGL